ncbi:MAG TPA: kelch repeat-containing protein [Kofleriaceae bacterium]|nr:kelch repeat-containing protein [Kofleriaceae bacterium]
MVAHAAEGGRCVPPDRKIIDRSASEVAITHVRLTVRKHAAGDLTGSFLCDRVLNVGKERPFLKLETSGAESVDLHAEGFRLAPAEDPLNATIGRFRRVATGSLLNVGVNAKTAGPLRMYPVEDFRCVDGKLAQARAFHSATLLPNGQVLFVGGLVAHPSDVAREALDKNRVFLTGSAEIYDPATGEFQPVMEAAPMPRAFHHAVLLSTRPPYSVLLVGGVTTPDATQPAFGVNTGKPGSRLVPFDTSEFPPTTLPTAAAPAETILYDPATRSATRAAVTGVPTGAFQAVAPLPDGAAVAGGIRYTAGGDEDLVAAKGAAVWFADEPDRRGTLLHNRHGATLSMLFGSQALLWGGAYAATDAPGELVNGLGRMAAGAITSTPVVLTGLPLTRFHTATAFDGTATTANVLVTGGFELDPPLAIQPPKVGNGPVRVLAVTAPASVVSRPVTLAGFDLDPACGAAEHYRPAGWESAVRLANGSVLVTGGAPRFDATCNDCDGGASLLCAIKQAALFTAPDTLRRIEPMEQPRFGHTSTELRDGTVLIAGGFTPAAGGESRLTGESEVYNPRTVVPPYSAAQPELNDQDDPILSDLMSMGVQRAPGETVRDPAKPGAALRPCVDL